MKVQSVKMILFALPDRNMLLYLFLKLIQIKWREKKKNQQQTNKIYHTVGTTKQSKHRRKTKLIALAHIHER